jgi:hypothetical protein
MTSSSVAVHPPDAKGQPGHRGLNLAISHDDFSLFQSGTADARMGTGNDFAIAFGANSYANAGASG